MEVGQVSSASLFSIVFFLAFLRIPGPISMFIEVSQIPRVV